MINMKNTLKELKLAYVFAGVMNNFKEDTNDQCSLCWSSGCDCESTDIKLDPFINLTAEEFHTV